MTIGEIPILTLPFPLLWQQTSFCFAPLPSQFWQISSSCTYWTFGIASILWRFRLLRWWWYPNLLWNWFYPGMAFIGNDFSALFAFSTLHKLMPATHFLLSSKRRERSWVITARADSGWLRISSQDSFPTTWYFYADGPMAYCTT